MQKKNKKKYVSENNSHCSLLRATYRTRLPGTKLLYYTGIEYGYRILITIGHSNRNKDTLLLLLLFIRYERFVNTNEITLFKITTNIK